MTKIPDGILDASNSGWHSGYLKFRMEFQMPQIRDGIQDACNFGWPSGCPEFWMAIWMPGPSGCLKFWMAFWMPQIPDRISDACNFAVLYTPLPQSAESARLQQCHIMSQSRLQGLP